MKFSKYTTSLHTIITTCLLIYLVFIEVEFYMNFIKKSSKHLVKGLFKSYLGCKLNGFSNGGNFAEIFP